MDEGVASPASVYGHIMDKQSGQRCRTRAQKKNSSITSAQNALDDVALAGNGQYLADPTTSMLPTSSTSMLPTPPTSPSSTRKDEEIFRSSVFGVFIFNTASPPTPFPSPPATAASSSAFTSPPVSAPISRVIVKKYTTDIGS